MVQASLPDTNENLSLAQEGGGRLRVYQVVGLTVVLGTGLPVALHHAAHGVVSPVQIALAFFLWLNAIIALWELCLHRRIDLIEKQYARFREQYRGRELDRVKDFFGAPLALGKWLSPTTWAELWSSYALFDESYANRKSYGFFIDVGNGYSTLLPSLACAYGMTFHVLPPRLFGVVLLLLSYQMWYGTLVYFGSYLYHRRYRGHRLGNVLLFVGLSNGLWFTFPLVGMWAGYRVLVEGGYGVFF